ncbi:MAG: metalloregulator ArsR/SmtB family transcription factor [Acidobacteriota bacterium]|nr:metalloregulator ArsR/SmtB family transcription factor [Acidobacteriota bacterium]
MASKTSKSAATVSIDFKVYERQAQICKAFANPVRLVILDLISKGEMQCSELQEALGITKANLSQHMTVLKSSGIVSTRRQGKQMICTLAIPEVKQACQIVHKVLERQWEGTQRILKSR